VSGGPRAAPRARRQTPPSDTPACLLVGRGTSGGSARGKWLGRTGSSCWEVSSTVRTATATFARRTRVQRPTAVTRHRFAGRACLGRKALQQGAGVTALRRRPRARAGRPGFAPGRARPAGPVPRPATRCRSSGSTVPVSLTTAACARGIRPVHPALLSCGWPSPLRPARNEQRGSTSRKGGPTGPHTEKGPTR
jgi:hypothetical protein